MRLWIFFPCLLMLMYAQRIADADTETLLCWSEQMLDAETLEEVFS